MKNEIDVRGKIVDYFSVIVLKRIYSLSFRIEVVGFRVDQNHFDRFMLDF